MRLWPTSKVLVVSFSFSSYKATYPTYSLSISLFRFPTWLYSARPLAETALFISQ